MASGISDQTSPDSTKVGAWLFRHRTAIPIPIALALLVIPGGGTAADWTLILVGVILTLGGEALRLAAVHQIGVISRTRSERLGPLVTSGPFGRIRNPLYVGNVMIWTGFALTAELLWAAPIVAVLLLAEYHAIVGWEEQLLGSRFGDAYTAYRAAVPRWFPTPGARPRTPPSADQAAPGTEGTRHAFSWRDTFFSERGTLLAIAIGYGLLWLKARF
jgi:protein-S-isoprenylcysteine O-methyltransferase Ste14